MKKSIVAFASVVLLSVSFGAASAQMGCGPMGKGMMGGGMGMMGMGRGMMGQGMMQMAALGLDSRQRAAVSGIMSRTMKEMVRKRAEMQIAAIELNELLAADPADMKAVEAALRKMEAMRTEMRLAHIKARMEIMSILTPDQKKRFSELMMRRPMMRGMGRQGMMGGMGMMQGMGAGQCGMMGGMSGMMMDGMDDGTDDDDMDDEMMVEPAPSSADMKEKGEMKHFH
ncbi:MAG: periplasmic heavy metal sensor [Thermodesulfovibrionales bacterium]|jgi:protein CpxP